MEQKTAEEIAEILTGWRDKMMRHRDPLRCAYDDDLCPGAIDGSIEDCGVGFGQRRVTRIGLLDPFRDNEAVGSAAPEGREQSACRLAFRLDFLQGQLGFENAGIGPCFDKQRVLVAAHPPDGLGAYLLFEFDAVFGDPDHLFGDLDVDVGALDLLGDIEPDNPPLRFGQHDAALGKRHARLTLAAAFERLRIGDGQLGLPEQAIAACPDAIVHIDRNGRIGTDTGLQLIAARSVDPRFARSKLGRCGDGPLDRLVER